MRNKIFKEKNKRIFLLCLMLLLGSKSFANEITINDMNDDLIRKNQGDGGITSDFKADIFYKDSEIKLGDVFYFKDFPILIYNITPSINSNISTINIELKNKDKNEEVLLPEIYTLYETSTNVDEGSVISGTELNIKDSKLYSFEIGIETKDRGIKNNKINIEDSIFIKTQIPSLINSIGIGVTTEKGDVEYNSVTIKNSEFYENVRLNGGHSTHNSVNNNSLTIENSTFHKYNGFFKETKIIGGHQNSYKGEGTVNNNKVSISDSIFKDINIDIIGGQSLKTTIGNQVILKNNTFENKNINIIGGKAEKFNWKTGENFEINNNIVTLEGNNTFNEETNIYGAYFETLDYTNNPYKVNIKENQIKLLNQQNADLSNVNLYGYKLDYKNDNNLTTEISDNNLIIDNFTGTVKSVNNFNNIIFENLEWKNGEKILSINSPSDLKDTGIILNSIKGGQEINIGDSMTIIDSNNNNNNNNLNISLDKVNVSENFNAGVSVVGKGEATLNGNDLIYEIKEKALNNQVNLLSENHTVATAFINQGTDLISDSLDSISRDGKYGLKTFASTYGNHSEYDVNSDLKINGWSIIAGVGSEEKLNKGDFAWGLFFENGNGNYRTYNQFNEEFFRGDGSIKYNGLGLMSRFEYNNGVYTEGSFRIGRLESETIDALKDGTGNTYDTKSESLYYGAHLGLGKLISLGDNTEIDIFGKVFHTYTDEDSFNVAGDRFEFDSITSDRVRVGTRLNMNKKDLFKVYCGLAYEYEFNGDSNMKVQDMLAPEQSLEGSTYITEFGINFKPSITSLWDFDINVRGYMGEREGFSGTLQATYTF